MNFGYKFLDGLHIKSIKFIIKKSFIRLNKLSSILIFSNTKKSSAAFEYKKRLGTLFVTEFQVDI